MSLSSSLPSSFPSSLDARKQKKIKHIYYNIGCVEPSVSEDLGKTLQDRAFKVVLEKGKTLGAEIITFAASSSEEKAAWLKDLAQMIKPIYDNVNTIPPSKVEIPVNFPEELKTPKKSSYPRVQDIQFKENMDLNAQLPPSNPPSKKRLSIGLPGARLVLPSSLLSSSGAPHQIKK